MFDDFEDLFEIIVFHCSCVKDSKKNYKIIIWTKIWNNEIKVKVCIYYTRTR